MISFVLVLIAAFLSLALLIYGITKLNQFYRRERIANFDKKRVFITGTDSGFGRELALILDQKGLVVYAGCYSEQGAEQLRKEASNNLRVLKIDVTKRETLENAKNLIEKDLPPEEGLWGLVNNAGIMKALIMDMTRVEDFREVMEVNFFGVITTTEVFLPMIKKARGRIVNVSSMTARCSSLGMENYACSKWALGPYCDGLRRSMKTFGVDVAVIEPGYHETNITDITKVSKEFDRNWTKLPNHIKEEYGEEFKESVKRSFIASLENYPLKGQAKDVARTISHALSSKRPKARYLCGFDANLIVRLMPFLPDCFLDVIMRHYLKYDKVMNKVN